MTPDIAPAVRAILAARAGIGPAELTDGVRLDTVGLDSMALVEAVFELEERFDIAIPFNANRPEDDADRLATVGAVIRAVETLVAARAA
jgi:acyl carrier protein